MIARTGPDRVDLSEILELTQLFESYRTKLLAMLRARIDPALECRIGAEAILHETFLVARRRWHNRPPSDKMVPYAWLLWLARQCLFDAWRREHSHREMPWPEQSSIQMGMGLVAKGVSPISDLVRKDIQAQVRGAIDALDPIDREIIWLMDIEGLSYSEVAQILEIREKTAHVRHYRALKRLRELIPASLRPEGG